MNNILSRRRLISSLGVGLGAISTSGWFPLFAQEQLAEAKKNSRHVILLWMSGGPSQMDTWDLKPGHENGGEFTCGYACCCFPDPDPQAEPPAQDDQNRLRF